MKIERFRLATLIIFCILAGGLLAYSYRAFFSTGPQEGLEPRQGNILPSLDKMRAHLYFLGPNHRFLKAEERSLAKTDSVVDQARSIVSALIQGPEGKLLPTLPSETSLLSLYVGEDGVAYIDFDNVISEQHPGGSLCELFTIFSIVNTLALNIQEIESVKILINGAEAETLAGHIDIRFPFRPDVLMIK